VLVAKALRLAYKIIRFFLMYALCLMYVCFFLSVFVLRFLIITSFQLFYIFIYVFVFLLLCFFRFLGLSVVFWKTKAYPFLNNVCEYIVWLSYDIFCWTPYVGFDYERLWCVMLAMWASLASLYLFFIYFNDTSFLYNTFFTHIVSLTDYPSWDDWLFCFGFVPFVMFCFAATSHVYRASWKTVEEAQVYYILYRDHGIWPKDVILQRGIWREFPRAVIVLVCYPFYLLILSWFLFVFLEISWVLFVVNVLGIKSKVYFICFYFFVLYLCFYLLVYFWDRLSR